MDSGVDLHYPKPEYDDTPGKGEYDDRVVLDLVPWYCWLYVTTKEDNSGEANDDWCGPSDEPVFRREREHSNTDPLKRIVG